MEKKITTASGVPIYSYTNPAQNSFFISLFVRAGSMFEEQSGITHFFEHVAIRNVNYMMSGELYAVLDRYGLEFNASTSNEMVQFYITGADANFRLGAEIITRVLSGIALPSSEIDRERDRIRAEIREVDEASTLAGFTASRVFEGTKLARSITGTLGSVAKIGVRALENFRRQSLVRENVFLYVTGNVRDDDIEYLGREVDKYDVPSGVYNANIAPVPHSFGSRSAAVYLKGADFTKVRFNFDVDMTKCNLPELDLLYDQLLGGYNSEFFLEMSERRGIFYDLSGTTERYKNIGVFSFSYELKEAKLAEAVGITVDILRRFKSSAVAEKDFITAGYIDNAMMLYDDYRELNFTFSYDNHIMDSGYESIEMRRSAYKAVTPERLRELAGCIFTPDNLTLTVKGKRSRIDTGALRGILLKL